MPCVEFTTIEHVLVIRDDMDSKVMRSIALKRQHGVRNQEAIISNIKLQLWHKIPRTCSEAKNIAQSEINISNGIIQTLENIAQLGPKT